MNMSICLNMIVKNESEVIEDTLKNIMKYIKISYWVISDTGSTDNTKDLVRRTLQHIPGELLSHEWRDFAYNRTLALKHAFNKTDYVFIFDADDKIHGEFKLPNKLSFDRYLFKFGPTVVYHRPLLINNRKQNFFIGVLHEYLNNDGCSNATLDGNYYIESGRTGFRSKNPNKYAEDAIVLKNAFEKEQNKGLATRYAFYCAQSYKDSNQRELAIEWYKKCLQLDGWAQEKYYACLQIGLLETNLDQAQFFFGKSITYDPERIEGIVYMMERFYKMNHHTLVNALYHKFKNYNRQPQNKLFINMNAYQYEIEFCNTISAYYVNDLDTGYHCCRQIIFNSKNPKQVELTINNLQFYKSLLEKDKTLLKRLKFIKGEDEINPLTKLQLTSTGR